MTCEPASDFAAMRDAFRTAGLCSATTPATFLGSWCAGRDNASDGEDSLYVPSPQRVKIRRRLALARSDGAATSPQRVRRAAEAAAVQRLIQRRAIWALAAAVERRHAARLLGRRADACQTARGWRAWRAAADALRRRADANSLLDAYARARRTKCGLARWRRRTAHLRRRRRLRTHGRRCFRQWATCIRYGRRLRAGRAFGALKRAAAQRRRREGVVAEAYRRARLRLHLRAWVGIASSWKVRRVAYERETFCRSVADERETFCRQRVVAAVFARWARVRRFRRAARDFLRARGLEKRRTRQLARRCLRGWRARGRTAAPTTPRRLTVRDRSSRSLWDSDAIRRIHAPYT